MFYPGNYGFIPHTLSDDGDPMDILVVGPTPVVPGAIIRCRPIGALMMVDEAGGDEKILAVPVDKLHPFYAGVDSWRAPAGHPDRADRPLLPALQGPGEGQVGRDRPLGRSGRDRRADPPGHRARQAPARASPDVTKGPRAGSLGASFGGEADDSDPHEIQEHRGAVAQALFLVAGGDVVGGRDAPVVRPLGPARRSAARPASAPAPSRRSRPSRWRSAGARPASARRASSASRLGLDQPALVVPRLGPGVGEQDEDPVQAWRRAGAASSSRTSPSCRRTLVSPCSSMWRSGAGDAVLERLGAQDQDVGVPAGLRGHVLAAAEADLQPDLARAGHQGARGRRARRDAAVRAAGSPSAPPGAA